MASHLCFSSEGRCKCVRGARVRKVAGERERLGEEKPLVRTSQGSSLENPAGTAQQNVWGYHV